MDITNKYFSRHTGCIVEHFPLRHSLNSFHLSLDRKGRLGTTDDFATSFLHFSLFSTALWDLANSSPVHSLMLSSHLFLCLPDRQYPHPKYQTQSSVIRLFPSKEEFWRQRLGVCSNILALRKLLSIFNLEYKTNDWFRSKVNFLVGPREPLLATVKRRKLSHATTASPEPSFRAPWRVGGAVVGRGNAGWKTSKGRHPCPCQNCPQRPSAEKKTG